MANDNWGTPQYVFDWLDEEFHFDLDVAANETNKKCQYFLSKDGFPGLETNWNKFLTNTPTCWMNPPYSNPKPWLEKAYKESLNGCTVVCLLPADISTQWFHDWVIDKAEIRLVQGRINFDNPVPGKYSAPKFGSMIAIYGPEITPKIISVKRPDRPKKVS